MRSLAKLCVIGLLVLIVLSTMVVVEPYQQAIKLTGGAIAGDRVHESGLMWKLPWPIQSASVHDVRRVRSLPLTARRNPRERARGVNVWERDISDQTDRQIEPFLVARSRIEGVDSSLLTAVEPGAREPGGEPDDVSASYSLLDAEIMLRYRIQETADGLIDYLRFAPDTVARRETLSAREKTLRALALREVSLYLSTLTLDQALARERGGLARLFKDRIQAAFDARRAGVEVVAVDLPLLRPSGSAAQAFEDLMMARQDQEMIVAEAERSSVTTMTYLIGDAALADEVLSEIDRFNELRTGVTDPDAPPLVEQRGRVEQLLLRGGGNAGQQIALAETDRWVELMSTRAQASRVAGQLAVYRAAPELYRQREIMRILQNLAPKRKFILGIDPARVNIDVDLVELDPVFQNFNRMSSGDQEGGQ